MDPDLAQFTHTLSTEAQAAAWFLGWWALVMGCGVLMFVAWMRWTKD